jgi:hypothetical protein
LEWKFSILCQAPAGLDRGSVWEPSKWSWSHSRPSSKGHSQNGVFCSSRGLKCQFLQEELAAGWLVCVPPASASREPGLQACIASPASLVLRLPLCAEHPILIMAFTC